MDNKKVTFFVVLGFFLLSLMAAGYFSYRLWVGTRSEKTAVVTPTPKTNLPNGSIVKKILSNDGGVMYEIQGSFVNSLEKFGTGLKGKFVVKGDSSNQKIPIYLGTLDGYSTLGTYSGSFNSGSVWERVPIATILETVKPGASVRLRLTYYLTEKVSKSAFTDFQSILDSFSDALSNGREYKVPVDFYLSIDSIGIIR
jgi:hypothetical protein